MSTKLHPSRMSQDDSSVTPWNMNDGGPRPDDSRDHRRSRSTLRGSSDPFADIAAILSAESSAAAARQSTIPALSGQDVTGSSGANRGSTVMNASDATLPVGVLMPAASSSTGRTSAPVPAGSAVTPSVIVKRQVQNMHKRDGSAAAALAQVNLLTQDSTAQPQLGGTGSPGAVPSGPPSMRRRQSASTPLPTVAASGVIRTIKEADGAALSSTGALGPASSSAGGALGRPSSPSTPPATDRPKSIVKGRFHISDVVASADRVILDAGTGAVTVTVSSGDAKGRTPSPRSDLVTVVAKDIGRVSPVPSSSRLSRRSGSDGLSGVSVTVRRVGPSPPVSPSHRIAAGDGRRAVAVGDKAPLEVKKRGALAEHSLGRFTVVDLDLDATATATQEPLAKAQNVDVSGGGAASERLESSVSVVEIVSSRKRLETGVRSSSDDDASQTVQGGERHREAVRRGRGREQEMRDSSRERERDVSREKDETDVDPEDEQSGDAIRSYSPPNAERRSPKKFATSAKNVLPAATANTDATSVSPTEHAGRSSPSAQLSRLLIEADPLQLMSALQQKLKRLTENNAKLRDMNKDLWAKNSKLIMRVEELEERLNAKGGDEAKDHFKAISLKSRKKKDKIDGGNRDKDRDDRDKVTAKKKERERERDTERASERKESAPSMRLAATASDSQQPPLEMPNRGGVATPTGSPPPSEPKRAAVPLRSQGTSRKNGWGEDKSSGPSLEVD